MVKRITKNRLTYLAFFLSIALLALLCFRYYRIGIPANEIIIFSFFSVFSISILFASFKFYNSVINPISIYFPFLILLSYSFIQLSNLQVGYSIKSILVILFSIISYILSSMSKISFKKGDKKKYLSKRSRRFLLFLLIIGAILTFLLESRRIGYIPILHLTNRNVYSDMNENVIPLMHYFITLLAFLPSWIYILYKQGIVRKRESKTLILITLFILLNYLSKQIILLLILCSFGTYIYYNKINKKIILSFIGGLAVIFILITIIRFQSIDTTAAIAEYYRIVAGIDNPEVSFTEAFLVEYSTKRFVAFNNVINYADNIKFLGLGQYTLKPIISILFLDNLGFTSNVPELNTENLVTTYIADPYLDFRFIGVILLNILYGFLSITFYKKIKSGDEDGIVGFWIIVFCLLMGVFINFFNTMMIWLGFLFNRLLIKPSINE
ncbi:MAG: O-antigen polymerase [Rikenellaceae bacterium]